MRSVLYPRHRAPLDTSSEEKVSLASCVASRHAKIVAGLLHNEMGGAASHRRLDGALDRVGGTIRAQGSRKRHQEQSHR